MPKRILLAVTGGIAAYKSCELVRLLKKQGYEVQVALSQAACEFVSAQTFQALSAQTVLTEQGGQGHAMAHINATRGADVMLIAPATANTLAKIAHGIADNLISEIAAARNCPLVVAPAMNVEMWHNPANLRNIAQLQADGVTVLLPVYGEQACGEIGIGRMLEPAQIADLLPDTWTESLLKNKRVLISAGATYEAIDPVRGITNISSGQMGMALARACRRAGAEVSLIHGNITAPIPYGLTHCEHTISAQDMYHAVMKQIQAGQDVFISVAAVADFRVTHILSQKWKKEGTGHAPIVELTENPDILREVAALPHAPFCVGFAAESDHVLEYARAKRHKKNIPMLIANRVADAMGKSHNQITILDDKNEITLPMMSKDDVAWEIVQHLASKIVA